MLIPILLLIISTLMGVFTFIVLFFICRDYFTNKNRHKSTHSEFKYIQIFYMIYCVIILILCVIFVFGFYDMFIKNF